MYFVADEIVCHALSLYIYVMMVDRRGEVTRTNEHALLSYRQLTTAQHPAGHNFYEMSTL